MILLKSDSFYHTKRNPAESGRPHRAFSPDVIIPAQIQEIQYWRGRHLYRPAPRRCCRSQRAPGGQRSVVPIPASDRCPRGAPAARPRSPRSYTAMTKTRQWLLRELCFSAQRSRNCFSARLLAASAPSITSRLHSPEARQLQRWPTTPVRPGADPGHARPWWSGSWQRGCRSAGRN